MTTDLLDIQPRELKFTFEVKKQSSCSVRLVNKSQHHVAFKVKTTSPKKYCVRPNVGIIMPKSVCDFTVTMQAQRTAPPDLACKDKFLIQSTVVPVGSTDEDITPTLFVKDGAKYVQESKMKVVLIIPDHSPNLSPINGNLSQFLAYEALEKNNQVVANAKVASTEDFVKVEEGEKSKLVNDEELKRKRDEEELKLVEDIKMMKSKIDEFESKLCEAEATISRLTQERKSSIKEREILQHELVALRQNKVVKKVQVGFPFLFVCMVALVSALIGNLLKA